VATSQWSHHLACAWFSAHTLPLTTQLHIYIHLHGEHALTQSTSKGMFVRMHASKQKSSQLHKCTHLHEHIPMFWAHIPPSLPPQNKPVKILPPWWAALEAHFWSGSAANPCWCHGCAVIHPRELSPARNVVRYPDAYKVNLWGWSFVTPDYNAGHSWTLKEHRLLMTTLPRLVRMATRILETDPPIKTGVKPL